MPVYKKLVQKIEDDFLKTQKQTLNVVDSFVSLFVIGPLVVCYWKSTWHLIAFHYNRYFPFWPSYLMAIAVLFVLTLLRPILVYSLLERPKHIKSAKKTLLRLVMTKLYQYLYIIFNLIFWMSLFEMPTMFFGKFLMGKCE